MNILIAIGLLLVIVGLYFIQNEMTSSGVTMGKTGNHGTGTLDGKGIVFCGLVIGGFGLIFRDNESDNSDN